MPEDPQNVILILKVLRDIMKDFSVVVENMLKVDERYGVKLSELHKVNFTDTNSLQQLTKALPPENLGLLIGVVTELLGIQDDFRDFANYDEKKLGDFSQKLKSITEKFDKVLE